MLRQAARLIAICVVVLSLGDNLSAADKTKATSNASANRYERPADPSLYAGAETCKTCHEDIFIQNTQTLR
jgi:hypothetical protein